MLQYYKAKRMTPEQIATFIEERKWDYRGMSCAVGPLFGGLLNSTVLFIAFGFAAALAERIPIVGLIFSISNRIGAAMWAHGMLTLLTGSWQ